MSSAATLRRQIEAVLASRIPPALTPAPRTVRPVAATGIQAVDYLLKAGLPLGAITEIVGLECSGRTFFATFLLRPDHAGGKGLRLDRCVRWTRPGIGGRQQAWIYPSFSGCGAECDPHPASGQLRNELGLDGGTTHTRTVRPALPAKDKELWIKLLHLDPEAHPPQAAIPALSLAAEPGSTSKVPMGLFSLQLPEPARLNATLARIRAIVGNENVGCVALRDTHRLDGFRMEPFTVSSSSPSVVSPKS